MGKKRKRPAIFCWYCDKTFEDETVLVQHQKAKHFKCHHCSKKFNSAQGMGIHVHQVHKEEMRKVPNSVPGRDSFEPEIYGMDGVPNEDGTPAKIQKVEPAVVPVVAPYAGVVAPSMAPMYNPYGVGPAQMAGVPAPGYNPQYMPRYPAPYGAYGAYPTYGQYPAPYGAIPYAMGAPPVPGPPIYPPVPGLVPGYAAVPPPHPYPPVPAPFAPPPAASSVLSPGRTASGSDVDASVPSVAGSLSPTTQVKSPLSLNSSSSSLSQSNPKSPETKSQEVVEGAPNTPLVTNNNLSPLVYQDESQSMEEKRATLFRYRWALAEDL
eukprot:TRINITY_DN569_c0_g1_i2.p1 TRINITY_DN569_c0_g1~~TRINITY_DN569_c0_g1_i2.p1  ORF type:complete len:331 (+),score=53.53 TRINITY_DN569_c0_g1_i2:30-995(+)